MQNIPGLLSSAMFAAWLLTRAAYANGSLTIVSAVAFLYMTRRGRLGPVTQRLALQVQALRPIADKVTCGLPTQNSSCKACHGTAHASPHVAVKPVDDLSSRICFAYINKGCSALLQLPKLR